MIACPHPACDGEDDLDAFEAYTVATVTGRRLYVDCPHGHTFEVEVTVPDLPF